MCENKKTNKQKKKILFIINQIIRVLFQYLDKKKKRKLKKK